MKIDEKFNETRPCTKTCDLRNYLLLRNVRQSSGELKKHEITEMRWTVDDKATSDKI